MAAMKLSLKDFRAKHSPRVAVIHQGALGDFLLALHAIEGLYQAYLPRTDIRFDFWTRQAHFELIASKPYAGRFHPYDGPELIPFLHEASPQILPRTPDFFNEADAVLVMGQKGSRTLAANLVRSLACPVEWLQSFPNTSHVTTEPSSDPGSAIHVRRFLTEQLERAGWQVAADSVARIVPEEKDNAWAREWLEREFREQSTPVLIHAGSGGRRKIWPLHRWWELLCWFAGQTTHAIIMALGPADEVLKDFGRAAQDMGVKLIEAISLPRLAALLAACRIYVGNDSGVSHLAAAVGTPAVVIFGPTDPAVWAPLGPSVRMIRKSWDEATNLAWQPTPPSLEPTPDSDVLGAIRSILFEE